MVNSEKRKSFFFSTHTYRRNDDSPFLGSLSRIHGFTLTRCGAGYTLSFWNPLVHILIVSFFKYQENFRNFAESISFSYGTRTAVSFDHDVTASELCITRVSMKKREDDHIRQVELYTVNRRAWCTVMPRYKPRVQWPRPTFCSRFKHPDHGSSICDNPHRGSRVRITWWPTSNVLLYGGQHLMVSPGARARSFRSRRQSVAWISFFFFFLFVKILFVFSVNNAAADRNDGGSSSININCPDRN